MQNEALVLVGALSDEELVARLKQLTAAERRVTAEVVAHLAELDARELHLRAGFSSLFAYCREVLGLSEHAAYNRIEVARAVRRFPVLLEQLAVGDIHLSAARVLVPHLTAENHRDVLASARHRSRRETEEIVARLAPKPDTPERIRKLPAALPAAATATAPPPAEVLDEAKAGKVVVPPPTPRRREVTPLAPERYKLEMTVDREVLDLLRQAKELLAHAVPDGNAAEVLRRALRSLLRDLARDKSAQVARPQAARPGRPGSRVVPAAVRRAVWLRDGGRCTFRGQSGHRCGERFRLEYHHRHPFAAGGEPTIDNIALRCASHNRYEGRIDFGARATRAGASRLSARSPARP